MQAALLTVLLGTAAFYSAERGHNPKVTSVYDALVYVSTSLSAGHSDVLAKTEAGKLIGSALMTYGPGLAPRVFDPPREAEQQAAEASRSEAALKGIADQLERILLELQAQRAAAAGHG